MFGAETLLTIAPTTVRDHESLCDGMDVPVPAPHRQEHDKLIKPFVTHFRHA